MLPSRPKAHSHMLLRYSENQHDRAKYCSDSNPGVTQTTEPPGPGPVRQLVVHTMHALSSCITPTITQNWEKTNSTCDQHSSIVKCCSEKMSKILISRKIIKNNHYHKES